MREFCTGEEECGVELALLCECSKPTDVTVKQYYRVTFYSDFICMKTDGREKKKTRNCLIY